MQSDFFAIFTVPILTFMISSLIRIVGCLSTSVYNPRPLSALIIRIGGVSCLRTNNLTALPFEPTSKRRKGYPSEAHVKRGQRIVAGDKYLVEKLGRNDPCPCGSGRRFQVVLYAVKTLRRLRQRRLLLGRQVGGI